MVFKTKIVIHVADLLPRKGNKGHLYIKERNYLLLNGD